MRVNLHTENNEIRVDMTRKEIDAVLIEAAAKAAGVESSESRFLRVFLQTDGDSPNHPHASVFFTDGA